MDIHINELKIEDEYNRIPLSSVSFRDIDQEFIIVHSAYSFGSITKNYLYYCFIRPYEGLFFRLIGMSDEDENELRVDEDKSEVKDATYIQMKNEIISKIIENGDLLSNQLIVNMTYDYYDSNDDLSDLMETRKLTWLDEKRMPGNPDWITVQIGEDTRDLRLLKCDYRDVLAEAIDGHKYILSPEGTVKDYTE